jgi:hypothetical protein
MQPTQGREYMRLHHLGADPTAPSPERITPPQGFVEVPAIYTTSIILGGDPLLPSAQVGGSVALRPERFALRRITWATSGDAFAVAGPAALGVASQQGRCIEASWGDEFTQFLGNQPALLSALFGDSNGYLDLPGYGILFQGRQTLNVKLRRILWPAPTTDPVTFPPIDTRIDICFQGVGLLPANTGGVSGSV